MSPGDIIIFVDDHQLISSVPFLGTVVSLFPFCFCLLNTFVWMIASIVVYTSANLQIFNMVSQNQSCIDFSFLIRKNSCVQLVTPAPFCFWLWAASRNNFLITVFYLYEYNYIFPNKCILQIHPWWRLSVIILILVVQSWTSVFCLSISKNANLQTSTCARLPLSSSPWLIIIS